MRLETRELFPRHRDMHQGTYVTHVPWWMPGSLNRDFLWSRWRVRGSRAPGACATRNFTYLVRGPLATPYRRRWKDALVEMLGLVTWMGYMDEGLDEWFARGKGENEFCGLYEVTDIWLNKGCSVSEWMWRICGDVVPWSEIGWISFFYMFHVFSNYWDRLNVIPSYIPCVF